jgi:hypothetical protein
MQTQLINKEIEGLEKFANLLDSQFSVFGLYFGLDSIIGLLPVAGDMITAGLSLIIVQRAYSLGVSNQVLLKMVINILIDTAIGSIPVIGDIIDVGVKANKRNVEMIRGHFQSI